MFGLVVRFDLRDAEAAADFDDLVAKTLPGIRDKEPGTLMYAVHAVEGEPLARVFYELYKDRGAFEAHEAQDHTRRFLSERDRYVAGLRVEFFQSTDGKGMPGAG